MTNSEFINNRKSTDESIAHRLKVSRWFARGMFALGLAGGAFTAIGGPHNNIDVDSGIGVGVVASGASFFERRSARKNVLNIISAYAKKSNTYSDGYLYTVLKVENGELCERTELDLSIHHPIIETLNIGTVASAWTGAAIANAGFQGEAMPGLTTDIEAFGGYVVAMGLAMLAADHFSVNQDYINSMRKLDNIDRSIRFED